jgi:hypothetical protein
MSTKEYERRVLDFGNRNVKPIIFSLLSPIREVKCKDALGTDTEIPVWQVN